MFNSFFSLSLNHAVLNYKNCFFGHLAYLADNLSQLLLHPWQPRCDVTGNMAKSGCGSLIYSRPIMYGRWGEDTSRRRKKGPLGSQERDGWTLKIIRRKWVLEATET
jgi:hypothetical protein